MGKFTDKAKGAVNKAAVGAVAGYFAHHHGMAGATAGCAVGHHYANRHMHRM